MKQQVKRKRSATQVSSRKRSGHDLYVRRRNEQRRALPKAQQEHAWKHLKSVHQAWRDMPAAQKAPFELEAQNANAAAPLIPDVEPSDPAAKCKGSPWGLGSVSYACSVERLQGFVDELLPDCKRWLRECAEACRAVDDAGRLGTSVIPDVVFPNVDALSRLRKSMRPCYEVTPGLCKTDPLFTPVQKFHSRVRKALSVLGCEKKDDGNSFFLFAGHTRKRKAREALGQEGVAHIGADAFHAVCVSDQLDVRLGLKTLTICDFDLTPADQKFDFSSVLTLRRSERNRFVEEFSHGWLRGLIADGPQWWLIYKLAVEPVAGRYDQVALTGSQGVQACFGCPSGSGDRVEEAPRTEGEDLDMACAQFLEERPVFSGEPVAERDPFEEVMDDFFGGVGDSDVAFSDGDDAHASASDGDVGRCGDESENDASDAEEELFTHDNPRCSRVGNKIFWDKKHVGLLTSWQGNLSCHCKCPGHSGCRTPASTTWPSDSVLVDWLLSGLAPGVGKTEHVQMAQLLRDEHRPRLTDHVVGECEGICRHHAGVSCTVAFGFKRTFY